MTEKQEKAIRILHGLIENCAITQDEFITILNAILEKETQFVPGLYPNGTRLGDFQDFTPRLKPADTHGVEQPKLWDQVVYTYNSTSTTDDDIQKICEKNPIRPIEPNEWDDNEF
jgi:hypothetical protein